MTPKELKEIRAAWKPNPETHEQPHVLTHPCWAIQELCDALDAARSDLAIAVEAAVSVTKECNELRELLDAVGCPPFFVAPMPLNIDDEGPCSEVETVRTEWEVWDQLNIAMASRSSKAAAEFLCERLNKRVTTTAGAKHRSEDEPQ